MKKWAMTLILCVPQLSWANCETGAYIIHTVATYPNGNVGETYTRYDMSKDGFHAIATGAAGKSPTRPRLVKMTSIRFKDRTCKLGKISFTDDAMSDVLATYQLGECGELFKLIPKPGYSKMNFALGQFEVMEPLEIIKTSNASDLVKAAISEGVAKAKLYADRGPDYKDKARGRISQKDISRVRMEFFKAGSFNVGISILTVKSLLKFYPHVDTKDLSFEFPVIFFYMDGETPRFFGDGSNCAGTRIAHLRWDKFNAADRFALTAAFDLNGDQKPEVVEINDAVAYQLTSDGKIWVIRSPAGC